MWEIAQAAPDGLDPTAWISPYLDKGILGATALILGYVCVKLFSALRAESTARLDDAKEVREIVTPLIEASTAARVAATAAEEAHNRLLETLVAKIGMTK